MPFLNQQITMKYKKNIQILLEVFKTKFLAYLLIMFIIFNNILLSS